MFKPGKFVAKHLEPHDGGELSDDQIQPNGVDLTIDKVLAHGDGDKEYPEWAFLGDGEYRKPARTEAPKKKTSGDAAKYFSGDEAYKLEEGGYVIVYNEEITIPDGFVGIVFPRSRLLRTSAHVGTALWDMGYSGRGEGSLFITQPTFMETDMPVAQMAFVRATAVNTYDGSHQGERK